MAAIAIVIVSHSRQLAEGVRELVTQMVRGKVKLATAAGIDDPQNPLGTDAMQVREAIESVYSDDGVLVLMDLGSALMSAEMALEFLPNERRDKVYLCEAPLVEGALAAAVAAATGSNIERVIAEAREALTAKAAQLGSQLSFIESKGQKTNNQGQRQTKEIHLIIRNQLGLHARPAAKFVTTAAHFQSQIEVRNLTKGTEYVRADSINQVATLGVRQGHEIAIAARGIDADEAIAALQALVEDNFGESDRVLESLPLTSSPSLSPDLQGIPASPGIAIAPAFLYCPAPVKLAERPSEEPQAEWQQLLSALQIAKQEIRTLRQQTASQIGNSEAAIFDAHVLFLEDPALLDTVRQNIFERHLSAEAAWHAAVEELVTTYRQLEDPYMRSRAADVTDLGQRVLRLLTGSNLSALELTHPVILVAPDLTPSEVTKLDPEQVLGICMTRGSATSHSAILARTLGIPVVVGLTPEVLKLRDETCLALDGESGKVWIDPDADTIATLQSKRDRVQAAKQKALATAQQPAITRDGKQIPVLANISGIADAKVALNMGAEGVGVMRTEFLYLDRTIAPSEDEQLAVYHAIAQLMETRPFIIRTLDVGGDKPVSYLGLQPETNPFLGWRGIRFCLDRTDIFKTQLRAILRASPGHKIKIMFPMISTVAEVRQAKAILAEVQSELRRANIPFDEAMEVGIMVEVPSAAAIADRLASEVDFFSLGTNDLSQYVMACDRTNAKVAALADALHPAVLRMIQQTVQAAHEAGIWVGLCGELAADPLAVPILLGLGIDEISLNPQKIGEVKGAIAQITVTETQAIAQAALKLNSAASVRELIAASLGEQQFIGR
ncbi:phosphotransferase system HPr (HPr) family protein [Pleurocapsa sp. PCC 7327]|uniref:phosphoenolpyruvate--protein phosphotransferase n=1 Tax=Pleurocapsa sp. PCC 7327 TaxID=118163 RepID=UPI00029FCFBA|nr:phosphoenolpyruvate--protein phosphotransferase [Pleurocapsa sp. PCC 7327]AFY75926.1 phosphotransferase system HPr (HPr) family protein [Pleurocapsa sp. PCC 7327]